MISSIILVVLPRRARALSAALSSSSYLSSASSSSSVASTVKRLNHHHHHYFQIRGVARGERRTGGVSVSSRYCVRSISAVLESSRARARRREPCQQDQQYPPPYHHRFFFQGQQAIRFLSSSSFASDSSSKNVEEEEDNDATGQQTPEIHLDFFGEPVTFLTTSSLPGSSSSSQHHDPKAKTKARSNAMAALDGCLLAVVSKGQTCVEGGDEAGLEMQPAHAAAISWAEALRFASVYNNNNKHKDHNDEDDNDDKEDGEKVSSSNSDHPNMVPPTTLPTTQQSACCPMLAVVAVAPVMAQAGVAYVKHLDSLLSQAKPVAPGMPPISLYQIAKQAVLAKDNPSLNVRERLHLQALHALLHHDPNTALVKLVQLLRISPGDVLALSLVMDLAQRTGNGEMAKTAAGSVAAYWNERQGGFLRPSIPGHAMATSLVALGLAVGGRVGEAEPLAERAISSRHGKRVAGALATWALCHVYDAGGRVAEGISALANTDGIAIYEGCGFLFMESRLGGYGARFALDREERGRGTRSKALRLYEEHFQRVLDYSGFAIGQPWQRPQQRAPLAWSLQTSASSQEQLSTTMTSRSLELEEGNGSSGSSSLFSRLFAARTASNKEEPKPKQEDYHYDYEIIMRGDSAPSTKVENWDPACEDVLTWLPPTPQFVSDATLLLLRLTLNGTVARSNPKWLSLRKSWEATLQMHRDHQCSLAHVSPLVSVSACLLFHPTETGADKLGLERLGLGLYLMGELLGLGAQSSSSSSTTNTSSNNNEQDLLVREVVADREPDFWLPTTSDERQQEWKAIVEHLASALDGASNSSTNHSILDHPQEDADDSSSSSSSSLCARLCVWEFEGRPILEHAVVYACCKCGDVESLCLARSICARGVTLRPNSPEEWWRYSIVLGLLGDEVASEDALTTSIHVGAGQGARR